MGRVNYCPEDVVKKYYDNELMRKHLETYSSLRKHEPGDECYLYLFDEIFRLNQEINTWRIKLENEQKYVAEMEKTLARRLSATPEKET